MENKTKKLLFGWVKPTFFAVSVCITAFATYRIVQVKNFKQESVTGIINNSTDGSINIAKDPLSIFTDD